MSEPKDLLIINEQLRQSNRRWKSLALAACATLILIGLFGMVKAHRARIQAEAEIWHAQVALADAYRAASQAQQRYDWKRRMVTDVEERESAKRPYLIMLPEHEEGAHGTHHA